MGCLHIGLLTGFYGAKRSLEFACTCIACSLVIGQNVSSANLLQPAVALQLCVTVSPGELSEVAGKGLVGSLPREARYSYLKVIAPLRSRCSRGGGGMRSAFSRIFRIFFAFSGQVL